MTDRKQNVGNAGEHDGGFDRELAVVLRAYRDADAGPDGPPEAMADAIRAAARRAAKSGPRSAGKSWVSRWSAPLSAAALVVLTTSVGFLALDEQPALAPATGKKALAEDRKVAPRDQPAQFAKPMPERNRSEATVVAQSKVLAEESRRETVVNSPVVAAAAPVAKEAQGFVADPLAADAVAANKDNAAPSATVADKAIEPAEAWIKRILELKKHGKAGEFEDELVKFRKQYPNFKLPDELKTDK